MHRTILVAAGVFLLLALPTRPAVAQTVPWNLVEGSEGLRQLYLNAIVEVLMEAESYGDCSGTILECLNNNPEDVTARRLAAFVVRRIRADKDPEEIVQEIEEKRISAFPDKIFEADLTGLVPSGNADAPVRIVLYADFGCPYCNVATETVRELTLDLPDMYCLYFKNYPLKTNKQAVPAALALLAADRQGKFWMMNDLLYKKRDELCDETWESCAGVLGLNLAQFTADRKNPELIQRLRNEKLEAIRFGVATTPGIFINGKRYIGVKTPEELMDRLDEELEIATSSQ